MQVVLNNFVFIQNATVEIAEGFNVVKGENLTSSGNSSNGSGKTLLLEAIAWCLWGHSIRGAAQASMIGPHGREMSVTVSYGDLSVTRSRTDTKVNVVVVKDGETINFQKASQAQERINEELRMNWDNAKILVYFGEHSRHVLDMTASERRDAIVGLMEYPEETHNQLSDNLNDIIRKTDVYLAKNDAELAQVKTKWETTAENDKRQIEGIMLEVDLIEARIASCDSSDVEIPDVDALTEQLKEKEDEIKLAFSDIHYLNGRVDELDIEWSAADRELNTLTKKLREHESEFEREQERKEGSYWGLFNSSIGTSGVESLDIILEEYQEKILLNSQYAETMSSWNKELGEATRKLEGMQSDYRRASDALSVAMKNHERTQKDIAKKRSECSVTRSSVSCGVCPTCKQGIDSEATQSTLKATLEALEDSIAQSELELVKYASQIEEIEDDIAIKKIAVDAQSEVVAQIQSDKPELERLDLSGYNERYQKAISEHLAKETLDGYLKKVGWNSEELDSAKARYASSREQLVECEDDLREANQIASELKESAEELGREIRRARQLKEELQGRDVKIIELTARLHATQANLAKIIDDRAVRAERGRVEIEEAEDVCRKRAAKIESKSANASEIKKMLAAYKHHTVTRFVQTLEEKINAFLQSLSSDIRCKVEDDGGEIEFLFTDSSKKGQYYPYKLASRGERTRIKKVFFQVFIEMFSPPFVLSDESYDGLDDMGAKSLSEFTYANNQNRCFIEATPLDLDFSGGTPNMILCQKSDDMIRIIQ